MVYLLVHNQSNMKRIKLLIPILIYVLLLSMGCNNSGNENNSTAKDTASSTDTIKSDPSTFSPPH